MPYEIRFIGISRDSDEKKLKAEKKTRFPKLSHLDLSENELADYSTFASLAGLRRYMYF